MELLMALAISVVILTVTVTVFRQATGVYRQANAKMEAMLSARSALEIIAKDLQGAFLTPPGQRFVGLANPTGGGAGTDPASMTVFLSTPVAAYAGTAQRSGSWIYYYLNGNALVRYDFPCDYANLPAGTGDFTNIPGKTLAYGVTQFSLRYYDALAEGDDDGDGQADEDPADGMDNDADLRVDEDPAPWVPTWNSTASANPHQYRRLPTAVQVVIQTVDRDGFLTRPGQTAFRESAVLEVGTEAPAQ
jgi:type II secretory pathway pseudopilin PulG